MQHHIPAMKGPSAKAVDYKPCSVASSRQFVTTCFCCAQNVSQLGMKSTWLLHHLPSERLYSQATHRVQPPKVCALSKEAWASKCSSADQKQTLNFLAESQ